MIISWKSSKYVYLFYVRKHRSYPGENAQRAITMRENRFKKIRIEKTDKRGRKSKVQDF